MPARRAQRHSKRPPSKPAAKHGGTPRGGLPDIAVIVITGITRDGELAAEPLKWEGRHKAPHIIIPAGRGLSAKPDDRVLAKLTRIKPLLYQAQVIRILEDDHPQPAVGVFLPTADGGIIEPVSRKARESFMVARDDTLDARAGELVCGHTVPARRPSLGMQQARITERLGSLDSPRAASLIAAAMHDLPQVFPAAALAEAEDAPPPLPDEGRADLRPLPLVTIDGEDARDFDDAVFAEPDSEHAGGWHIVVAIADVAAYVPEGSALDAEAYLRGNSVYFPDRVIPMLPERLSNGLCSLNEGEDRYCMAVHLWIDAQGNTKRYRFERGIMRSMARLTYTKVEARRASLNEAKDTQAAPLDGIIRNLLGAYEALCQERERRGALDLDLPEYKIQFDERGEVAAIAPRERLESHRLIEAYMVAANVAAADFLLKQRIPAIYRVHEQPAEEKLDELRAGLQLAGYNLHIGAGIKPGHFNRVLRASDGRPEGHMVHTMVLRSQMQAYYSPQNLGHFGLGLAQYCHFTSPIRRYSDLVVHRALVKALSGASGKRSGGGSLGEVALHISATERRAMMAERDAGDRYKAAFMSRQTGHAFAGHISGINEYGLYVTLRDNGITGFVPVRNLPQDFFAYDKKHAAFRGRRSKQTFTLGQDMVVRVQTANAITGNLTFEPEIEGIEPPPRPLPHKHRKPPHKSKAKKRQRRT